MSLPQVSLGDCSALCKIGHTSKCVIVIPLGLENVIDFKMSAVAIVTKTFQMCSYRKLFRCDSISSGRVERQSVTSYQNDIMMEVLSDVIASAYEKMK